MKLSRELKIRINKQAHAAGVAHGQKVKLQLLDELAAGLPSVAEAFGCLPVFDTSELLDADGLLSLISKLSDVSR